VKHHGAFTYLDMVFHVDRGTAGQPPRFSR
jgi:hypothetical protein